jgi:hypothetical protein
MFVSTVYVLLNYLTRIYQLQSLFRKEREDSLVDLKVTASWPQ